MTIYMSEIRFENSEDFVEVVAPVGTDMSGYQVVVYDELGNYHSTYSLGASVVTFSGNDGYLVERGDGLPDMGQTWGVALMDPSGLVVQFISGEGNVITAADGPAAGSTSIAGPTTSGGQSIATYDNGATYGVKDPPDPGIIPCFAPGTLIATAAGARAVETIRAGDVVHTLDHGPQTVIWTRRGRKALDRAADTEKPILIAANALGPNHPRRDLIVSQQHRILVGYKSQLESAFEAEVLVPAKALTILPGVRVMKGRKHVDWVHLAFARHEIIVSEGCHTESLLLGPMVVNRLTRLQKEELLSLFGVAEPGKPLNGPPARTILKTRPAREALVAWKTRSTFAEA